MQKGQPKLSLVFEVATLAQTRRTRLRDYTIALTLPAWQQLLRLL